MESTVKPALVLMMGRGVAMMATFLAPLLLVRVFDQHEFGTYKQLFLIYSTLYVIGSVLAESLFYFLPRSPREGGRYVANATLALAASGLAGLVIISASAPAVARWLGNASLRPPLPLLGAFLMLMLPSISLEIVMIARGRYRWGSWSYAASDVLRVLALVAPALVARRLDWLLLGAVAFAAARLCVALLYFHGEFGGGFRPRAALFPEQLAYALPFAATAVVEVVQLNYHQYVVAHRFDAATFAIYSVGCFQIPLLELVASPLANVMMVRMTERLRDGHGAEAAAIWNRTTRILALVFLPVLALLLVTARDLIVLLFTESYLPSVPIFMVWSLALGASVLQTDAVLRVYAATRFMLVVGVLKLLMVATLIGAFMSAFGLRGAVLVSLLAMVTMKVVVLARMRRLMGVWVGGLLPWRDLAGIAAAAAAAAVPALAVRAAVEGPALARLAVTGLVGAAAYAAIVFQFGLLRESERLAIRGWLQRFMPTAVQPGESRG